MSSHSVLQTGYVYARLFEYHCIAFKWLFLFALIFSAFNSINHSKPLIDHCYKCLLRKRSLAYGNPLKQSVSNKLLYISLVYRQNENYNINQYYPV